MRSKQSISRVWDQIMRLLMEKGCHWLSRNWEHVTSTHRRRKASVRLSLLSAYMGVLYWQCAQMILFASMIGLTAG
nr:hypothetical protein Iba_chr03aCG0260 [Ipomoea batatas]GMC71176.1 hypothetical protein Iba_chr03bCG0320 [Ipomoea batatas]